MSTRTRLEKRTIIRIISGWNIIFKVVEIDRRFNKPCGGHLLSQSELYHVSCNLRPGVVVVFFEEREKKNFPPSPLQERHNRGIGRA